MAVQGVDHINICTADLDQCKAFYCGILGLEEGWRPPFGSPGAWLYGGGSPLVHVSLTDEARNGESAVDHIAFAVKGYDEMRGKFDALGMEVDAYDVPDTPAKQLFVTDPDGVSVELNFSDGT
ncbi:MAG: glyoxalase [Rhodospirillaceae bacterium]|jgi:catechol 2,3-dioxygenase-like lactoylglutathione lyase family enzyme|nr:glyoxalase [Rhodospirillaceae bacterium]MBT6203396.1 glyoxalase [Rhodospirillaceae bacterium]MBT6510112.1 glyoxalase [Rhodospirillaceae bacterium]